jgi:hypothetical protein
MNAIIALALQALNAVLATISEIKSQGGLTDDQIEAQVQTITSGNTTAYNAMMAALSSLPPATTSAKTAAATPPTAPKA